MLVVGKQGSLGDLNTKVNFTLAKMQDNLRMLLVILFVSALVNVGQPLRFPFPIRRSRVCGLQLNGPSKEAKIVGGFTANQGEFPWMVSFKSIHGHFCGGTVISNSMILSAAHCFFKNDYLEYATDGTVKLHSLNVTVGEYSLKKNEATEAIVSLKSIHLHPSYNPLTKENDIALIEVSQTISSVTPNVIPACLPQVEDSGLWEKDMMATAVGWGKLNHQQDYYDWVQSVDALRKVEVKVWDREECIKKYANFRHFPTDHFLCAGDALRETCAGDSGGPLLQLNDDKWVVIGIVANGNKCGALGRPGIYTLVSDFLQWIYNHTK